MKMKVKIEKTKTGSRVIFEINNMAEAEDFHDNVAIRIAEPCWFIGHCYDLAAGFESVDKEYSFTPIKRDKIINLTHHGILF
jgi:hypothetical protein